MKITAQLNNLRMAPRKVRLVARVIRGKDAVTARQQLIFLTKRSSGPLAKLLESALQNAEHNFGLLKENLFIKDVIVNEGMKLKRFMPRAMGQAGSIQKKTSRITVVLGEKVPGLKANKNEAVRHRLEAGERSVEEHQPTKSKDKPGFESKSNINKKGVFDDVKNIGRKLFRRKSI